MGVKLPGKYLFDKESRRWPQKLLTSAERSAILPFENGYDIQNVQELLGHSEVKTTMIHTHVLSRGPSGVRSPVDGL